MPNKYINHQTNLKQYQDFNWDKYSLGYFGRKIKLQLEYGGREPGPIWIYTRVKKA